MPVEEVMHPGVVGCDPAAPLPVIARILADEQIHCVVVGGIERTREGERLSWGIVSDRDLIRALDATGESVTAAGARGHRDRHGRAGGDARPRRAADGEPRVTHLVVVDGASRSAIVSSLDVARAAGGG